MLGVASGKSAFRALRINIKSLAEEARINRAEMRREKDPAIKSQLTEHRRGRLRHEARYAQLALAFIRGMPYKRVEAKTREGHKPHWCIVSKKLDRFVTVDENAVRAWLES